MSPSTATHPKDRAGRGLVGVTTARLVTLLVGRGYSPGGSAKGRSTPNCLLQRMCEELASTRATGAEKAAAPHSSTLAWRIPGTREPDGLPSMGSHRVGHD